MQNSSLILRSKRPLGNSLLLRSENSSLISVFCAETLKMEIALQNEVHVKIVRCSLTETRYVKKMRNKRLCRFCGKHFKHKWNLLIHERYHTGDKPFTCQFCQKGFVSASYKDRHERTHTGQKAHKCNFC